MLEDPPQEFIIPEMETILMRFGIKVSVLEYSPALDYDIWEQDILYDFGNSNSTLTISQRIKSMARKARAQNNSNSPLY